jgi:hypothetical protein
VIKTFGPLTLALSPKGRGDKTVTEFPRQEEQFAWPILNFMPCKRRAGQC